jgi:translation initiation factor IF-2
VGELAEAIGETPVSVIKFLMTDLGVMAAVSQTLDPSTCEAVAEGFGKVVAGEDDEYEYDDDEEYVQSLTFSNIFSIQCLTSTLPLSII